VCPIAYKQDYRETMDYFRAILKSGETSSRALALTAEVAELNAAHYTAWALRRTLLVALSTSLKDELSFVTDATRLHPKNYQVWFHRRWLIGKLGVEAAREELTFTAEILSQDGKNYHAWSSRQYVLKAFSLWSDETTFIDAELSKDVCNNSAYNQRAFVVAHSPPHPRGDDVELDWVVGWIRKAPNNESSWNYAASLRGARQRLHAFCQEQRSAWPVCAPLVATLVDLLEEEGLRTDAAALCNVLLQGLDDVHAKYWAYRGSELRSAKS